MNRRDLLAAIDKRLTLRITTRIPKHEHTGGFPLDFSKEFWLVQEVCDFRLLGYVAIPTRNIDELRFGKFERSMDRMLTAEGITPRVRLPKNIDLHSFESLFQSLQTRKRNVLVEVANPRRTDTGLYVGAITDVGSDHFRIHHFSALGKWDRAATKISYHDICQIEFDSPYVKTFSKYLPPRPQTK